MSNAAQKAPGLAFGQNLTTGELQGQLSYWRKQLADLLAALELPTDRPRAAMLRFQSAAHSVTLPVTLAAAVQQLSRRDGGPLVVTLLSAFQTLLHRYSGEDEIVVGCPRINQNPTKLEGANGSGTNLLLLRTEMSGDPTFQELLRQVRKIYL